MTGVIIFKEVATWCWTRSFDDLKFKMKKVTVQLKKLLLEEGINRTKENNYNPPCIFQRVQEFNCDSKCVQSVFKCVQSVFKCVRVWFKVWNSVIQCVWVYLVWFKFE